LHENGHTFVTGASRGFDSRSVLHNLLVCATCGTVRRRDGANRPCRGAVRVAPRAIPIEQRHCQNGNEACLAGRRDGVVCPADSCDIDDGIRAA
jgi:hypothetical protein